MSTRTLASLFDRIVAGALPLVTTVSPTVATGCCPPYHVNEVRAVSALPDGWSWGPGQAYLQTDDEIYAASPGAPSIGGDECNALCGGQVEGCVLVSACTPISSVDRSQEPPVVSDGDGGSGGSGGGASGETGPCAKDPTVVGPLRVSCEATYGATCGRRPWGLRARCARRPGTLAAFLGDCHRLEAASVVAFADLGGELAHHRAPRGLVLGAVSAMHDERRHAAAMAGLVRKHGGRIRPLSPRARRAPRSVLAIALENVREGCVRETYGALLATWQARQAEARDVRAAFAAIAADETRHAALSHAVHAWAMTRLSAAERAAVAEERRRAVEALAQEVEASPPTALARAAGLPAAPVARFLVRELVAALA